MVVGDVVVGLVDEAVGRFAGVVDGLIEEGRVMGETGFVGITISTMIVSFSALVSSNVMPSLSNISAKPSKPSISSNQSRGSDDVVTVDVVVLFVLVVVVSESVTISVVLALVAWVVFERLSRGSLPQAANESNTGTHARQAASFFIKRSPLSCFRDGASSLHQKRGCLLLFGFTDLPKDQKLFHGDITAA